MRPPLALALAFLASSAACSRSGDAEGKRRIFSREEGSAAAGSAFDFGRPLAALDMGGDELTRRLGSYEWSAAVEWSVARQGEQAQRVRAVERHRVREAATGEFDVSADVDPGAGPGSVTGKDVIFAGGMTYARARYAPWRERPTDRGRDARRFRDESLGVARSIARLYGDALALTAAGDATVLGRPARRFKLSLAKEAAAPPAKRPAGAPEPDEDTKSRLRFLEGRVSAAADGELLLDAATGAPLRVRITGAFGVAGDPTVRATLELLAQVKALGGEVPAIAAPKGALPDERKAAGVAGALDAAGLRKRGEEKPEREEPGDDAAEQ